MNKSSIFRTEKKAHIGNCVDLTARILKSNENCFDIWTECYIWCDCHTTCRICINICISRVLFSILCLVWLFTRMNWLRLSQIYLNNISVRLLNFASFFVLNWVGLLKCRWDRAFYCIWQHKIYGDLVWYKILLLATTTTHLWRNCEKLQTIPNMSQVENSLKYVPSEKQSQICPK